MLFRSTSSLVWGILCAVLGPLLISLSLYPLLGWPPILLTLGLQISAVTGLRTLWSLLWYGGIAFSREEDDQP